MDGYWDRWVSRYRHLAHRYSSTAGQIAIEHGLPSYRCFSLHLIVSIPSMSVNAHLHALLMATSMFHEFSIIQEFPKARLGAKLDEFGASELPQRGL